MPGAGTFVVAWIVAPLVTLAMARCYAWLAEALLRTRLPRGSGLPMGLAIFLGLSWGLTQRVPLTSWPLWVLITLALLGAALRVARRRALDLAWAPVWAGVASYLLFAAPVMMTGAAGWAGWVKLDDGASFLAFVDRLSQAGRAGIATPSSTYDLIANSVVTYPIGSFGPVGSVPAITGIDPAWYLQPYMALMGALLACVFFALLRPFIAGRSLRAVAAVVASQASTLYAWSLWGGVKEVLLVLLLATIALVLGIALRAPADPRPWLLAAIGALVTLAVTGRPGLGSLLPLVVIAAIVVLARYRPRAGRRVGWVALAFAVLMVPVTLSGNLPFKSQFVPRFEDIGNLFGPLSALQAAGIWPVGDFRLRPTAMPLVILCVVVVIILGVMGMVRAVRARRLAIPMLVASALVAVVVTQGEGYGGAWLAAKALVVASPILLLVAMAGAGGLASGRALGDLVSRGGARVMAMAAAAVVAAGVLASNALAYREAWVAPAAAVGELAEIGQEFAGRGPTLMVEYSPYGVRHFLRQMQPESAGEWRVRRVPLRDGTVVGKGAGPDVGGFADEALQPYELLVIRRSPSASRPPAGFRIARTGTFYNVWERDRTRPTGQSFSAGDASDPAGLVDCAALVAAARAALPGARVAFVSRTPVVPIRLDAPPLPEGWQSPANGASGAVLAGGAAPGAVVPTRAGAVTVRVAVPRSARYALWTKGSYPGHLEVLIDGREVASGRAFINGYADLASPLGSVDLTRGEHSVRVVYSRPFWQPGAAAGPFALGPLYLTLDEAADARIEEIPAEEAGSLCGRRLDWAQVMPAG